jgi:hypothetical protein
MHKAAFAAIQKLTLELADARLELAQLRMAVERCATWHRALAPLVAAYDAATENTETE